MISPPLGRRPERSDHIANPDRVDPQILSPQPLQFLVPLLIHPRQAKRFGKVPGVIRTVNMCQPQYDQPQPVDLGKFLLSIELPLGQPEHRFHLISLDSGFAFRAVDQPRADFDKDTHFALRGFLPQYLAQPRGTELVNLRALRPRGLAAEVEHEVPLPSWDVGVVEDAGEGRFARGVGLDKVSGVAAVLEFWREVRRVVG